MDASLTTSETPQQKKSWFAGKIDYIIGFGFGALIFVGGAGVAVQQNDGSILILYGVVALINFVFPAWVAARTRAKGRGLFASIVLISMFAGLGWLTALLALPLKPKGYVAPTAVASQQAALGKKQVTLLDDNVTVYAQPSLNAPVMTILSMGSEVEVGLSIYREEKDWLPTKSRWGEGYILKTVQVFPIKPIMLLQKDVALYQEPNSSSTVIKRYNKNAQFMMTSTVKSGVKSWFKVRDNTGCEGFIDGNTLIRDLTEASAQEKTPASPVTDMLVGGAFVIGGIILSQASYDAVRHTGGTYYVFWGAVIWGGIQFLRGLIRFFSIDQN